MGIFDRKPNVEKLAATEDTSGLAKALKHRDQSVRLEAVAALGKIGNASALDGLSSALNDNSSEVRLRAINALRSIGEPAVELLIHALDDKWTSNRRAAVEALREIRDARSVEGLIMALNNDDLLVRFDATTALGDIGNSRALEGLSMALSDKKNVGVRLNAIVALGKTGDAKAAELLAQALNDNDEDIRRSAVRAIGRIGGPRAVEILGPTLNDKDRDVRLKAIEALGGVVDARSVEPLLQALEDEDWQTRLEAAHALDKIGWQAGNNVDKAHYLFAKGSWDDLVKLGEPSVELLLRVQQPGLEVVKALGRIGDLRAAETIVDLLFSGETLWQLEDQIEAMRPLFGGYTELVIHAAVGTETKWYELEDGYEFQNSTESGDMAVKKLCAIVTQISNNILHRVSQKKDTTLAVSLERGRVKRESISFQHQRNMSSRELQRRGNPPYNPSAYLQQEAWRLDF